MCWARGIRRRVRPQLPRQCEQNPPATHSAQGLSPFLPWPLSMSLRSGLSLPAVDDAHWTPPRFLKVATGSECSGKEFGILEDDQCLDTGLQATLPRARIDFRLQPAPTTALADQPHYPDSSRVVCHSQWPGANRVPSQSSGPRELEPGCIGAGWGWERSDALRLRHRHETTFRSGCPRTGSLEIASGCGERLVRGQRISLTLFLVCAPSPERQAKNPLNIEHNIRTLFTLACVSTHAMQTLCSPAAFRFRNQQQQSFSVGASHGRSRRARSKRARSLFIQAALLAPSMAERDIILEALAKFPDPSEETPARWPGLAAPEHQLSPTQPVMRRSETGLPPPSPP